MKANYIKTMDFVFEDVENDKYMAQLGDITIKYIGSKEDTARGKREIFEIERLCK